MSPFALKSEQTSQAHFIPQKCVPLPQYFEAFPKTRPRLICLITFLLYTLKFHFGLVLWEEHPTESVSSLQQLYPPP